MIEILVRGFSVLVYLFGDGMASIFPLKKVENCKDLGKKSNIVWSCSNYLPIDEN